MEDEKVCQFCQDAAADSPYTMEEAMAKQQHYDMQGYLHPNCRCFLQPYYAYARLPVTMGRGTRGEKTQFTARRLGKVIADELKAVIKVGSISNALRNWRG
jgi:hypothetical protein